MVCADGPISSALAYTAGAVTGLLREEQEEENLHASTATRVALVLLLGIVASIDPATVARAWKP